MRGSWTGVAWVLGLAFAAPAGAELSAEEIELKVAVEDRSAAATEKLGEWVARNTGSWNAEGLEQFAPLLAAELRALGFEVTLEVGAEVDLPGRTLATGPLLIARRSPGAGGETEKEGGIFVQPPDEDDPGDESPATLPRILLSGHYDTVFEPDHAFQEMERDPHEPDLARGPGVADMKGGLVVMLEALHALAQTGDLDRANWVGVFNSDEEIGSLGSRAIIEREARDADYGFVFEAAQQGGAMVRSRRGLGQFHMLVQGVSAHAGSAHEKGRSAVVELAEKILMIEALTDYNRGVTLNVGTVSGGTKRNVVPGWAEAWIDLRYDDVESGRAIQRDLEEIAEQVLNEGTRTTLWGRLHRPPKPVEAKVDAMLALHRQAARDLGIELPAPVHAGGGTDGSLMAAVDLPALDSMGVVGNGAHTDREAVVLSSLVERAALAAVFLRRLVRQPPPALRSPEREVDSPARLQR